MAHFTSGKYPALTVRFSNRSKVHFERGKAEVEGDLAKQLTEFANRHPDYEIEQVEADEKPRTRKEILQDEARAKGLDDSGTIAELEARLADADDPDFEDGGVPEDDTEDDE